jgi:hypothetical protein
VGRLNSGVRGLMRHHCIRAGLITLALTACDSPQTLSNSPQTAAGETPIRYVICGLGDHSCFVAARFKDFDGCESHKKWSEMLCESESAPGQMVCREDKNSVARAYCTK